MDYFRFLWIDEITLELLLIMKKIIAGLLGCLFLFMANATAQETASTQTQAEDLSLERCQDLQNRIEEYDRLRKKGGKARQMEQWKQEREKLKDEFRDGNCRQWGKQIK